MKLWVWSRLVLVLVLFSIGFPLFAQDAKATQTPTMDASEIAFLKPAAGEGTFGDKVRWKKTVDPKDPTRLVADIQRKSEGGDNWTTMGEYLGHSDDGRLYLRATKLTVVLYYAIERNAPPPLPQKKHFKIADKIQKAAGGVVLGGILGGKGGEGVAKAGGAASDAGTDISKVEHTQDQVNGVKDGIAKANGSKAMTDDRLQSGEYTVYPVAPNDVPHNLSTAELKRQK